MIFLKISFAKEKHHYFLLWGCRRKWHSDVIKRLGYTWYTFEKPSRNLNLQVQISNLPHTNFWGVVLYLTISWDFGKSVLFGLFICRLSRMPARGPSKRHGARRQVKISVSTAKILHLLMLAISPTLYLYFLLEKDEKDPIWVWQFLSEFWESSSFAVDTISSSVAFGSFRSPLTGATAPPRQGGGRTQGRRWGAKPKNLMGEGNPSQNHLWPGELQTAFGGRLMWLWGLKWWFWDEILQVSHPFYFFSPLKKERLIVETFNRSRKNAPSKS